MPDQPSACMMPALQEIRECRTPGPLGYNDRADPNWLRGKDQPDRCYSPGPLGINDYATPLQFSQWLAAPGATQGPTQAQPTAAASGGGPLQVSQGQVTFDAEGNDLVASPYYSRKIIWPGNAESGVTIGRGYDMGS